MINGPHLPTCTGCVAVKQIAYYNHDKGHHESLCYALRQSGDCQLQIAHNLTERQIEAMNNLADALRQASVPVSLVQG